MGGGGKLVIFRIARMTASLGSILLILAGMLFLKNTAIQLSHVELTWFAREDGETRKGFEVIVLFSPKRSGTSPRSSQLGPGSDCRVVLSDNQGPCVPDREESQSTYRFPSPLED